MINLRESAATCLVAFMRCTAVALLIGFGVAALPIKAAACSEVTIQSPNPFMGNNDEVVQLSDGSIWQIKYEYNYMYEYYAKAIICHSTRKLIVKGKIMNVVPVANVRGAPSSRSATGLITVVFVRSSCDYFIAEGKKGYYLLEWYGGRTPSNGDTIAGSLDTYGFKDIVYVPSGGGGRVWVEDYWLSRDSAVKKYVEKCS